MRTQDRPQCRWVPVVDGSGRQRLEMQWTRPGAVRSLPATSGRVSAARHAA